MRMMLPDAVTESAIDLPAEKRVRQSNLRVHWALAACSVAMLTFCILAAPPGISKSAQPLIITVLVLTAPLVIPAALFHDRRVIHFRVETEERQGEPVLPPGLAVTGPGVASGPGKEGLDVAFERDGPVAAAGGRGEEHE